MVSGKWVHLKMLYVFNTSVFSDLASPKALLELAWIACSRFEGFFGVSALSMHWFVQERPSFHMPTKARKAKRRVQSSGSSFVFKTPMPWVKTNLHCMAMPIRMLSLQTNFGLFMFVLFFPSAVRALVLVAARFISQRRPSG